MDASVIAGGVGDIAGGVMGLIGQQQANAQSQQNVVQQEQFQETMSNTAYQRATADMTAAGLNPLMMYGSGAAASTPMGGAAPVQNAMAPLAASAAQVGDLGLKQQAYDAGKANIASTLANVQKTLADTDLTRQTTPGKTAAANVEAKLMGAVGSLVNNLGLGPKNINSGFNLLDHAIKSGTDWWTKKNYESPLGMGTLGNTPMPPNP